MVFNFAFSQTGNSHFARIVGGSQPKFLVGSKVGYLENVGLSNLSIAAKQFYRAEDYKAAFKFWAYFIAPTAQSESRGSFVCLNTYDRAKFTFGFMQFAAHVPNGDFVKFFKKLLALDSAREYFPKLIVQNKRIHYRNADGTLSALEDDVSTQNLMDYFNPTLSAVENQELICAARMVHWAANDAAHRKIQVESAIGLFRENMKNYAARYNLDGFPDRICSVVCDIRHQGRASSSQITDALDTNRNYDRAFNNLLELGMPTYEGRIKTLRAEIKKLQDAKIFGKKYKKSTNEFV